jgi:hypothetical protein
VHYRAAHPALAAQLHDAGGHERAHVVGRRAQRATGDPRQLRRADRLAVAAHHVQDLVSRRMRGQSLASFFVLALGGHRFRAARGWGEGSEGAAVSARPGRLAGRSRVNSRVTRRLAGLLVGLATPRPLGGSALP